jgi:fructokinase
VEFVTSEVKRGDVFFADRVSRSTVDLAEHYRRQGALVYFEPSAAGDEKLFREMLQLCDVLKYSTQRARSFSELLRGHKAHLEIETLGEDGLRFRMRDSFNCWNLVPSFEVKIKDSAGSGDWTSAGLLNSLFRCGKNALADTSKQEVSSFLEHAQALAAINCQFEGARGVMYQMNCSRLMDAVTALEAKRPAKRTQRKISLDHWLPTSAVCPRCKPNNLTDSEEQRTRNTFERSTVVTTHNKGRH